MNKRGHVVQLHVYDLKMIAAVAQIKIDTATAQILFRLILAVSGIFRFDNHSGNLIRQLGF